MSELPCRDTGSRRPLLDAVLIHGRCVEARDGVALEIGSETTPR